MAKTWWAALAAALFVSAAVRADDAQKELRVFEGSWRLASLEADGERQEVEQGEGDSIVIRGGRITAGEESYSFTIDPAAELKLIDLVRLSGDDKGQKLEGIFRLEGDELTVCLFGGYGVKSRPTAFASKDGCVLFVLKRKKE